MNTDNPSAQKKLFHNAIKPVIYSSMIVIGILIGYYFSFHDSENNTGSKNFHSRNSGTKIGNLLDYIEMQYVDTVNKNQLEDKTIISMLKSLDPHSDFIPAQEFASVNEPLEGNFDGIGVEFNIIGDTIRVVNPIIGGPSEKIGIKAGDRIVKINGLNVAGKKITTKNVFEKLRGQSGTAVTVTIKRHGIKNELEYKIIRGKIPIYSIDAAYMLKPQIGYIKISRFAGTTYEEYIKAFNDLTKQGMKKMIIDLRGNGGGFLKTAVELADEFLTDGLHIVYTEGRRHPKKIYSATSRGGFEKNSLAVLIDEGSASASEIVAGALQDNDRATIIGRRSFGKGLVQDQIDLNDGSAVRLTIARYYTPTGRCIQKPYNKTLEEYYSEEYERFSHGELYNSDSIKLDKSKTFRTPGGKTVYGGGGIMPDVFVPLDTSTFNSGLNHILNSGIINTFAFAYTDAHRNNLLKKYKNAGQFIKEFKADKALQTEFENFLVKKNIKGIRLKSSSTYLDIFMKAIIGRNLFDKDAYYPILNEHDKVILKAEEVLR